MFPANIRVVVGRFELNGCTDKGPPSYHRDLFRRFTYLLHGVAVVVEGLGLFPESPDFESQQSMKKFLLVSEVLLMVSGSNSTGINS